MSKANEEHLLEWDKLLTDFVLQGQESMGETLVDHVLEMPLSTLQEQFKLLSSISNYHWWASLDSFGKVKSSKSNPKYHQHMLFFPGHRKGLPVSPRNLLMHGIPHLPSHVMPDLAHCTDMQKRFVMNLMQLVKYDQEIEVAILFKKASSTNTLSPPPTNDDHGMGPPQKKRRYAFREVTANPEDLLEGASGDGLQAVGSSVPQRTMFTSFSEELHCRDSVVQWRMHSEDRDIVILNDYSPSSGQLKPLDYVHVTACKTDSEQVQIKCTCRIYQHMHGKALRKAQMEDGSNTVLAASFTCMHCRFYSTYLQEFSSLFLSQDCVNKLHEKVRQTEIEVNAPVVLLGESNPSTTTKLSVAGCQTDTVALVHIHFTPSGCFAKCQDGVCQTLYSTKKRVPAGISLRDLEKGQMCDHIFTLFHNQDVLEELFPDYFNPSDPTSSAVNEEADLAEVPDIDIVNQDDVGIRNKLSDNLAFNLSEGLWECPSYSHYKPKMDRFDPDLVSNTQTRLMFSAGPLNSKGRHSGPVLSPLLVPTDGSDQVVCAWRGCEATYTDLVERVVTVYCRQVSIRDDFKPIVTSIYHSSCFSGHS